MKKTTLRCASALFAIFLVGCSYDTESFSLATYYTIRFFDDATPTPRECGYAYFLPGQTAIFTAESDSSEYGSAYNYESTQISSVGHQYVFDGWYFQGEGGAIGEKANLYNISQSYIDAHGIDITSSSSGDTSSDTGGSLADSASSKNNYSIATKELRVYARFSDRPLSFITQYVDGVDYARTPADRLLTQTVTFGAGTTDTISGYAYVCPHCNHIDFDDSLDAGSPSTRVCPRCGFDMALSHDFPVPTPFLLSETDYHTETGSELRGRPDYGTLSDFQGWSLQMDFLDANDDGKPDAGYDPAVFTSLGTGVSFVGDDSGSLPVLAGHVTGDLFLDGHIDSGTQKRVNDLYSFVKPTSGDRWVKIGNVGSNGESVMAFSASYSSVRDTFSLKAFDAALADDITSANAALETSHYLGDSYTITKPFRSKILFTVSGFGGDVTTTAISYDELDGSNNPIDPVAIAIPNDLFPDTVTLASLRPDGKGLLGCYYGDESIPSQYRGATIAIDKIPDISLNQMEFLIKSVDASGYFYTIS